MNKLIKLLFLPLIALASDVQYPSGTVTKVYQAGVTAQVAMVEQTGKVEVEFTGTKEQFQNPTGATFIARGHFTDAPINSLTNWGKLVRITIIEEPLMAPAKWSDGSVNVFANRAPDWNLVHVKGDGQVFNIPVMVPGATFTFIKEWTNNVVISIPAGPSNSIPVFKDEMDITGANGYYKGRKEHLWDGIVDVELTSIGWAGSNIRYGYNQRDVDSHGWKRDSSGHCLGHSCIAFEMDGEVVAARFDHLKVSQSVKTVGNVFGGIISYNGKTYMPSKGQTVGFFICSDDFKHRSNVKVITWR